MRYAHLAPSNMHDAVKVLDRKPAPVLRLEPAEEKSSKTVK